jgi:hypothetical protein
MSKKGLDVSPIKRHEMGKFIWFEDHNNRAQVDRKRKKWTVGG